MSEVQKTKPTHATLPGLFGVPGALVFWVTRNKDGKTITPHTKMFTEPTGRAAQYAAETFRDELVKDPHVLRVLVCAVVTETRPLPPVVSPPAAKPRMNGS